MDKVFRNSEIFPKVENVGDRPWGTEELLAIAPKLFSVKRLFIAEGAKGGLQFHRKKNEVAVVISGTLLIRYDLGDGILREQTVSAGEVAHFPPGLIHQEEALTDCVIIEASTPHFNDRVRVEERYGMGAPSGLPTTSEEQIEFR